MTIFAVHYEYTETPNITETRPKHREFLRRLKDEGKLVGSGPLGDGGALIVLQLEGDIDDARELMARDPFAELVDAHFQTWDAVLRVF